MNARGVGFGRPPAMMTEHPLTGTIGAEIEGVDLTQKISGDLAGALKDALARHQVLFFRGQHLSIDQLKTLTRAFGAPVRLPYVEPLEGEPEVIRVLKEADEGGGVFGGDWHTDFSFLERRRPARCCRPRSFRPWRRYRVGEPAGGVGDVAGSLGDLLKGRDAMHVGKPYGMEWAPRCSSAPAPRSA